MTTTRVLAVVTSLTLLLPLGACTAVAQATPDPTVSPHQKPTVSPHKMPAVSPHKKAPAEAPVVRPQKPASELHGTQYAYVTAYQGNRVTFDLVEFFESPKAHAACVADGISSGEGVWCAEYYIRNKNHRLRWLGADPAGRYTVIDEAKGDWVPTGMAALLKKARDHHRLVEFHIDGGRILSAKEMWQEA
ncbi:hypothetical protein KOI35_00005 [Actinoplanes bogorensis]|uniref:Lipoprotein n=1 Tax=Paractinoplanes bogorensis TaxID=1610840 RepID=A0ABS5YGQ7_9ACTN|nr:hypothetical protein [Actinoplanes bogorensis]MBU2661878.1 hypothetical protein [Actinoplanes bogorensis]